MMEHVTNLHPVEPVHVDHDALGTLYDQLGADAAEDVMCRAMEELSVRLAQCSSAFDGGDVGILRKSARSLIAIADQIGMQAVGRVASDVVACIDHGDTVAQAATLARLMRSGEAALCAVWDLQDITV